MQGGSGVCSPLPQHIGDLSQGAADAQKLILAKDDEAFIVGIICGPDKLDDLRIQRYLLPPTVDHIYKWYHGLSFLGAVRPNGLGRK